MTALILIPARTPQTHCSSCGQSIYFAPHPGTGRPHPVSVAHEDAKEPTPFADGRGISHFSDCPTADQHRAPRTPATPATPTLDLRAAKNIPLMGATTSWDGWGQRPLGACPDKVLRAARRFFLEKVRENEQARRDGAPSVLRMVQQLDAIALILLDREANSPQQVLAL